MDSIKRFSGVIGDQDGFHLLERVFPHLSRCRDQVLPVVAMLPNERTLRVLDLGCGDGELTGRLIRSRRHVIGVDNEAKMLERAKEKYAGSGVKFVECGAREYLKSCEPDSFDAVISGFMLHNLSLAHRAQILADIPSVLKPGGIFVNCDKITQDDPLRHAESYAREMLMMADLVHRHGRPDVYLEWVRHYADDEAGNVRLDETAFHQALASFGFTGVRTIHREHLCAVVVAVKP